MAVTTGGPALPASTARRSPPGWPEVASGKAILREGLLRLPTLPLRHGGCLGPAVVAWQLVGPAEAPVVAALGGISAHRVVHDPEEPDRGWWREMVGPGFPLDTERYCVLGIDYFGGSGASSTPTSGQTDFPIIDAHDQAAAILAVCDQLGIDKLHAIAGASYGGMVGLAFAEMTPERVGHLLCISAAHRSNALATGWRSIQRAIVRHSLTLGDRTGGLMLARALAMTTYRTRAELERRFPVAASLESGRAVFDVERYLLSRGEEYVRQYRPEGFLCLSESIDLQSVDAARIRVPVTLVAIAKDQLVTRDDVRELASKLGGPVTLHELKSEYGHDAFLKERDLLAPAFRAALDGVDP